MANLINLQRALQQTPDAQECNYPAINNMIAAASEVIEARCRRTFAQATYDELHDFQQWTPYLYVNNPPIASVEYVRWGLTPALQIQFNDTNNNTQAATVEVTSTGITLRKLFNNSTTTNTFTFAAYPTFGVLLTAINLVSGWQATQSSNFQYWQTSDLTSNVYGTYSARNATVCLNVYWQYFNYFKTNSELGEIHSPGGFGKGYQTYRVKYVGGYEEIPDSIQQACAELVQVMYKSTTANPLMQSETLDKYSYTKAATTGFDQLSAASKLAIWQHTIHKVPRAR